jgi:hypothetical protein
MEGLLETRVRATSAAARRSSAIATDDRAARDKTIWEADEGGVSMHEIQRWTGDEDAHVPPLSYSQVQRICYQGDAYRAAQMEKALG